MNISKLGYLDNDSLADFLKFLDKSETLSSFLMRNIDAVEISGRPEELERFKHYVHFVLTMGWLEHTSDWDPYLIVTFADASVLDTGHGYNEFEISGSGVTFSCADHDSDEPYEYVTAISNIYSIELAY